MEEILASIRKILNEDDSAPATSAPEPAKDDVLVLDESMMVTPSPLPEPRLPEAAPAPPPRPETAPAQAAPAQAPPTQVAPAQPAPPQPAPPQPASADTLAAGDLVAPETAAAAATALGSLVRTLSAGRQTAVHAGGPTLEDMVRGELRAMLAGWLDAHLATIVEAQVRAELRGPLKAWLDTNLPAMVERLVRAEIERVVGRGFP